MRSASIKLSSMYGGGYGWLLRIFVYWLPLAVGLTVLSALVYVAVQQNFRQAANDPQIQIAEDASAQLEGGAQPQALVGGNKIDMAHSLAPFLIVYDDTGHVIASSVQLNGQTPGIPEGVFSYVRTSGEDRLSWQPQVGVRSATIVIHYGGNHPGFVLAGRSLREVENRESQLTQEVSFAWLAAIVGALISTAVAVSVDNRLIPRGSSV